MIILIKEEKNIYSLVEISEETRDSLIYDKDTEFKLCIDSRLKKMSLCEFIKNRLPNMGTLSSKAMTPGVNSDKTPALAIDRGEEGEVYIYLAELTTDQMFFAFDNAKDECLGSMKTVLNHIRGNDIKKRYAHY